MTIIGCWSSGFKPFPSFGIYGLNVPSAPTIESKSKGLERNKFKKMKNDVVTIIIKTTKGSKTKSANYDKFTDTGYTVTSQNPIFIKAIIRDVKAEELITKSIGLTSFGAKKIVIKERDISLIKNASRIVINEEDYYVYDDAVGNKLQIADDKLGYYTVLLFKKEI